MSLTTGEDTPPPLGGPTDARLREEDTAAGQGRPRKTGRQAEPRASKTVPALPRRTAVWTIPPSDRQPTWTPVQRARNDGPVSAGPRQLLGAAAWPGLARLPSDPVSSSRCPCVPCASFSKLFSGRSRQALGKVLGAVGAQHRGLFLVQVARKCRLGNGHDGWHTVCARDGVRSGASGAGLVACARLGRAAPSPVLTSVHEGGGQHADSVLGSAPLLC